MYWIKGYRDAVAFGLYFVRLHLNLILGQYYTANPTGIRWRWRHWQQMKLIKQKY